MSSFCIALKQKGQTDDVETKHLFFCLFSRLIRKKADQSGATKEEIRSDRVKDDKVCLSVNFLTLFNEHSITVIMPHSVLKRLWISFISPVILKKPSFVAMVNDFFIPLTVIFYNCL